MAHTQSRTVLNLLAVALTLPAAAQTAGTYAVTNLVSDGSVPATTMDANFINPWGIANCHPMDQHTGRQATATSSRPPTRRLRQQLAPYPSKSPSPQPLEAPPPPAHPPESSAQAQPLPATSCPTAPRPTSSSPRSTASSPAGTASSAATLNPVPVAQVVINNNAAGAVYTGHRPRHQHQWHLPSRRQLRQRNRRGLRQQLRLSQTCRLLRRSNPPHRLRPVRYPHHRHPGLRHLRPQNPPPARPCSRQRPRQHLRYIR